ncbi:antifungal protein ginkbilobin-like protein [Dioscorea cayenensis subsp. rotundata]|uniref:Antifungal protein ginkbilobin-like protein n=1 Tax=Dioscorea cayennensis subsp. rotundata TaxID=55577 RepID=A0AB40BSW8_DIOCR|nr:antifungal protein ginkbilobin-like protein [Dioscorea cayenensis subsp. rotundata]
MSIIMSNSLSILLFFASLATQTVHGVANTKLLQVLCNSVTYTAGDPFTISLSYVLSDLKTETPSTKTYSYYNISPFPNAFAYGHAACSANLTAVDCGACLGAAIQVMNSSCFMRIGARSTLSDCNIRYEQYPFV